MKPSSQHIQRVYLSLTLLNTLAASFIWGINTLFLLDAGLSNAQAFLANAFFTIGQVLFEIPTGIVADTWGRKTSYVLGTITLAISTLLYLWAWYTMAPFWIWAVSSMFLGLGFTFFSGATEAWLVDALEYTSFKGKLDDVFAKGQMVGGIAMLIGSVSGGIVAQMTSLGIPYLLRSIVLIVNFLFALVFMKDLGFTPVRGVHPLQDMKNLFIKSASYGFRNTSIRWIMLMAPFTSGVGFYAFYAAQPYLLHLYGNERAYGIAGILAAIVALAQIAGGFFIPYISRYFHRRTTIIFVGTIVSSVFLFLVGMIANFWIAISLFVIWALVFAAVSPVRQAYLNGLISSQERATVLSFDSVMGSGGGAIIQPILGRVADTSGYASSFMVGGIIQVFSIPFIIMARKQKTSSDSINL